MTKRLYYGDNLDVLRAEIADESVDLIYLDPPFNSAATYNVLFRAPDGRSSESQLEAFEDTWHWGDSAAAAFNAVVTNPQFSKASRVLRGIVEALGHNDMTAYLSMMAVRLIELHRVLKPTGSLYLHCDPTASHYLKVVLDGVFGAENFRSDVIWLRSKNPKGSQHGISRWGPATDNIFFYARSNAAAFRADAAKVAASPSEIAHRYPYIDDKGPWADGPVLRSASMGPRPNLVYEYKGFVPTPAGWRVNAAKLKEIDSAGDLYWTSEGKPRRRIRPSAVELNPINNCWIDIPPVNSQAQERLGYPTQKPLALLERIIAASSNRGDLVLDPFCGCGTAVHAAEKLGRQWIGIDITHLAVSLIERRMKDAFPDLKFEVLGTPKDIAGARDLAARDKHQFQWWAVSLVDAVPQGGKRKGADQGIDGIRWVRTGPRDSDLDRVIVSVKGGENISVRDVRDLVGAVQREGALGGLLITLAEPTRPMLTEAASHGFASTGLGEFRKIMVKTIGELMAGIHDDVERLPPLGRQEGFRRAARERRDTARQTGFDL